MKSNEFRIGNYVGYGINFDKSQSITTIKGIEEGKVLLDTDFICLLEQIKPIPINKELLLKCGGYVHVGWDDMEFIRFDEFSSGMFELEIIGNKFIYDGGEIEFLHDLQNCYYFHNNRKVELEITL